MKATACILPLLFIFPMFIFAQKPAALSPDEFQNTIAKESVQLLDVRTVDEFQGSHIKNAMQADWNKPDEFRDRIQYLDKSKPILVYCAVGGRSHAAAEWLRQNSFTDVRELKGGLTAWKGDKKPVDEIKAVTQITMEEYLQLTKSHRQVLVDFSASWCPPCKTMEPVLAQLKKELGSKFELVTIDAGTQTNMVKQLKVEMIPSFIIYNNGKEVWRRSGVTSLNTLKRKLGDG